MQDVYEALRERELAIERIRREIRALQLVSRLLEEDGDGIADGSDSRAEQDGTTNGPHVVADRQSQDTHQDAQKGGGLFLQFREGALSRTHSFFRRILPGRLLEREPQPKTTLDLFERSDPFTAA